MKQTVKTSRTAGYLEKIFGHLNRDWWNGELEEPIITIQSTPSSYGHVTVAKTWKRKDEERHELNLGAETINRPIEEVVATIMHEMVHLYHLANGIKDTSRGYSYHNKQFRDTATEHGLHIEHHKQYGWTITSPTEALIDYIIEKGWSEIEMSRGGRSWTPPPSAGGKAGKPAPSAGGTKKPSSTRKLVCPKCGQSVRATKSVNILCGDCSERMVEV